MAVYFILVVGAVIIIHFQQEWEVGGYAIKTLTYLFVYAYGTNIFKNLKNIMPNNVIISFLYYCFSFEFVKKIPFFSVFMEKQKQDKEQ